MQSPIRVIIVIRKYKETRLLEPVAQERLDVFASQAEQRRGRGVPVNKYNTTSIQSPVTLTRIKLEKTYPAHKDGLATSARIARFSLPINERSPKKPPSVTVSTSLPSASETSTCKS